MFIFISFFFSFFCGLLEDAIFFCFHQRGFGVYLFEASARCSRSSGLKGEKTPREGVRMHPEQRPLLHVGCAELEAVLPFIYLFHS